MQPAEPTSLALEEPDALPLSRLNVHIATNFEIQIHGQAPVDVLAATERRIRQEILAADAAEDALLSYLRPRLAALRVGAPDLVFSVRRDTSRPALVGAQTLRVLDLGLRVAKGEDSEEVQFAYWLVQCAELEEPVLVSTGHTVPLKKLLAAREYVELCEANPELLDGLAAAHPDNTGRWLVFAAHTTSEQKELS